MALMLIFNLPGCNKEDVPSSGESIPDEGSLMEDEKDSSRWFLSASFSVETRVSYSAGNDNDWAYGNQRKEFPISQASYVRIGSKVITDKPWGVNKEILVTYRFTGAEDCDIEISDGIVTEVETGDANIVAYTRTLKAEREKKAKEDIVIFRYTPNERTKSVILEVLYDNQVDKKYDVRNTAYFSNNDARNDEPTQ